MTKIPLIAVFSVWLFVVYGQIPVNNFDPYHAYYIPYTSTFTNQPNIKHVNDGTAAQSGGTTEFKNHPSIRDLFYQGGIFLRIRQLEETTASLASQLEAMQTALDDKADKTALDAKADKLALDDKADKLALDAKADKLALDDKADKTALNKITTPSSLGTIPTSCEDLKTIGFVKSGIYSVMVNKQVKNVYCDFTKPSIAAGLEKLIGTVDVKSTPTYFYAQLTSSFSTVNSAVPFSVKVNEGNAFTSGIFKAPAKGKYYFAFSGVNERSASNTVRVGLEKLPTGVTTWQPVGEAFSAGGTQTTLTFTLHATLDLSKDDQVRLLLKQGTIFEDGKSLTHYVGWLISESELPV